MFLDCIIGTRKEIKIYDWWNVLIKTHKVSDVNNVLSSKKSLEISLKESSLATGVYLYKIYFNKDGLKEKTGVFEIVR
ncbi:MAG: hypothetical protein IPP61_09945 [Cytophagaceae bacterium]|nr:hypothetical protein [Cytophagaceae bacterium]MBL0302662.1 hypothetical protein [Cytophagaceae bacterium]MBL0325486.1 hypothetical protein [Cytophagaceae bacterium]